MTMVLSKMRGTVHPTSGNAVLYMSKLCLGLL